MATEYHPHHQTHHQYIHHQTQPHYGGSDITKSHNYQQNGPNNNYSTSKVVAVLTLFPVGGTLFFLSGLTLAATIIGLAVVSPLFVIFSPVLVPAALAIALAVTGFVASGAFGVTAVSALTWMAQYVRRAMREAEPAARDEMEYLKRKGVDTVDYIGQKTKDAGQAIQNKAHEAGKTEHDVSIGTGTKGGKNQDVGKTNEGSKTRA